MIVVNLDLVIPAVILQEFENIKSLNDYQNNSKAYLSTMTISVEQVMNYAIRMRSWNLDRVIVNFSNDDIIKYLESNTDLFEQINHSSVYIIKFPETDESNMEKNILSFIKNLASKINYPPNVLKTVGLSIENICRKEHFIPKQTVADLIKKLQELPQDMPIATYNDPFDEIIIKQYTWVHTNYPYDQSDLDYISLE